MITLAWIAVIVPLLVGLLFLIFVVTDGFTKWENLFGLVVGVVLLGLIASLFWGVSYLYEHSNKSAPTAAVIQVEDNK